MNTIEYPQICAHGINETQDVRCTACVQSPAVEVHQTGHLEWTITTQAILTDEQAAAITFRAEPEQVRMGEFVQINDPEGIRIGHVSTATYTRRLIGPGYVVVGIELH